MLKSILPLMLAGLAAPPILLSSCITKEYAVTQYYEETAYRTEYATVYYTENISPARAATYEYELTPYHFWSSQDLYFKGTQNLWYYGYSMPEINGGGYRLRISLQPQLQYEKMYLSVFDMTGCGHIDFPDPIGPTGNSEEGLVEWSWISGAATSTWLDQANVRMSSTKFLGGRSNTFSQPDQTQIIDLDAGAAGIIAVIISGPLNKWNCSFSLKAITSPTSTEVKQTVTEKKTARQVPYQVQKQRTVYEFKDVPFWEALLSP